MNQFHKTCLLVLLFLLLAGCAASTVTKKARQHDFPKHPRIAILPFDNLSGKEKAGLKITECFQTLMATEGRVENVEYGTIFEAIKRYRVRSSAFLTADQIDSLAHDLQIDYVLTGSVMQYDEFENNYLGKVPQISFNTHLIDCKTKNTVWVAVSNGSGDKGELLFGIGAIRSADELAQNMVKDAVNRCVKLFKQ